MRGPSCGLSGRFLATGDGWIAPHAFYPSLEKSVFRSPSVGWGWGAGAYRGAAAQAKWPPVGCAEGPAPSIPTRPRGLAGAVDLVVRWLTLAQFRRQLESGF